jgi:hypothetical protein
MGLGAATVNDMFFLHEVCSLTSSITRILTSERKEQKWVFGLCFLQVCNSFYQSLS